jgi:hypothetical protein
MSLLQCFIIGAIIAVFATTAIWYLEIKPKPKSSEYKRGYDAAISVLNMNHYSPQTAFNAAQSNDEFDRGWRDACISLGAKVQ